MFYHWHCQRQMPRIRVEWTRHDVSLSLSRRSNLRLLKSNLRGSLAAHHPSPSSLWVFYPFSVSREHNTSHRSSQTESRSPNDLHRVNCPMYVCQCPAWPRPAEGNAPGSTKKMALIRTEFLGTDEKPDVVSLFTWLFCAAVDMRV